MLLFLKGDEVGSEINDKSSSKQALYCITCASHTVLVAGSNIQVYSFAIKPKYRILNNSLLHWAQLIFTHKIADVEIIIIAIMQFTVLSTRLWR